MPSTWPETIRSCSAALGDVVVRGLSGPTPIGWAALIAVSVLAASTAARSIASTIGSLDEDMSVPAASSTSSTGKNGSPLKWLPARPDSVASQTTVTTIQHTTPVDSPDPLNAAPASKPAAKSSVELFGDTKTNVPTPAPATKLGDDTLPALPLEPKPRKVSPKLDSDGAAEKSPYVAPNGLAPLNHTKPARPGNGESKLAQPLEQSIIPQLHVLEERCPSPQDLKSIGKLTTNITPPEGELPHDCPLIGGDVPFQWRAFGPTTFAWTASALCHKPLYFEDVQLERYGHMCGPWVQPFASAAQFFLTIPVLPYEMGVELPNECISTLGYYRPGDCAPYMLDPIPLSVRGGLFEAGAWVGGCFAIP